MGVKFEIADWKFEITLKELICQPVGSKAKDSRRNFTGGKRSKNINTKTRTKETRHELDYATRRQVS